MPKAAKQSTVPVGCRLGGDGAETGATVKLLLKGEIVSQSGNSGRLLVVRAIVGRSLTTTHHTAFKLNIPLKLASHNARV